MLEAQKHNPDIEVEIVWVFSWFDPAKEAQAAAAPIDGGADIIVQHTDSPAAMQIAQARGVYAFGQASDTSRFGPDAHLVLTIGTATTLIALAKSSTAPGAVVTPGGV